MRTELAEQLLSRIMEWDADQLATHGNALQILARCKYDQYGMFRPGERFLESLARWLLQLETLDERRIAVEFVLKKLIFVSGAELDHVIELVYRDVIRPLVRQHVSATTGVSSHRVKTLTSHPLFRTFQRQLLILGMSDGARLDRLRRASPELSHEQFNLVSTPSAEEVDSMRGKLRKALADMQLVAEDQFQHVVLVDDFTGSGFTLIREEDELVDDKLVKILDGKLIKVRKRLDECRAKGSVAPNAGVSIVLYIASESAERWVRDYLARAGLEWSLTIVQSIPDACRVTDPAMEALASKYYDPVLNDKHKGDATLGYRDSRLPLILSHNTPNNSIALLWGDTTERRDSLSRHALFARYERHSANRP